MPRFQGDDLERNGAATPFLFRVSLGLLSMGPAFDPELDLSGALIRQIQEPLIFAVSDVQLWIENVRNAGGANDLGMQFMAQFDWFGVTHKGEGADP